MKTWIYSLLTILLLQHATILSAQQTKTFKVIPLGVLGGIDESNLSAYMLAPAGFSDYVCLDAGTLHYGIKKAIENNALNGDVDEVLKKSIKGYLISHPHLDHVAGLIINSPDDVNKNIYGLPSCLDVLRDNYFTWKSWANFGSEGDKPILNKYHYTPLTPGAETPIASTTMSVQAFVLSHGNPYQSTAFLVKSGDSYLLYLGDTGADQIEKSNKLQILWQEVAPLVKSKKLKAIMIEVSYPDEQPEKQLFGHLTPKLLMHEMDVLGKLSGIQAMKGLPVVITHIKPSGHHEAQIKQELGNANSLQLKLIIPEQGKLLEF
ncbi:MBL fold metallo-hydrolase [Mucilaginibacter paludis]|uniref:Cyclic-AMP phosphodiesterase n=1 Tax=Mucilaginibacter paludis DSM 18603 TaxID=714943 RepID=H1YDI1_9SPHI|nr:3',5'-cyclic-nucleotide phosphodiesterase [Mucilaginibacter paludis]EHQ30190.1 cyclic-AMP phosphodiesterase [Mucilaginibacter paludis DSM 18603]